MRMVTPSSSTRRAGQPLRIDGTFQATPAPGVKPGTPIDVPLAFNFGPQPIEPGSRYEWRLTIDGETHDDWRVAFSTRPGTEV